MLSLLIDGYNLLHAMEKGFIKSLQDRRDSLIEKLHLYQVQKKLEMTVVFDGAQSPSILPHQDRHGNLKIVFTDSETTADDWIGHACEKNPGAYIVVSSDLAVAHKAEFHQCVSMSSPEFLKKLESITRVIENPYLEDKEEDEDESLYPRVSTRKKGTAKRLPKKERRKLHHLKNL